MRERSRPSKPFLTDVKTLREPAREHLYQGVVTPSYGGDVGKTIEILQTALATEIACVLRYAMHAVAATGMASESVKKEFSEHARKKQGHMSAVAERINQVGGTPNFNSQGLATRVRQCLTRSVAPTPAWAREPNRFRQDAGRHVN